MSSIPENGTRGREDGTELLASPRPVPRDRVVRAFLILGGGALAGLFLVVGMAALFVRLSWPHTEPAGNPEFGINYSCNQAEYLLLEQPGGRSLPDDRPGRVEWCAQTLGTLLEGLGVGHVRLSVEWSQVEPAEGVFDFRLLDALLMAAQQHGASVVLTVGMKAQRHPEFYLPGWVAARADLDRATISDDPYVRERTLAMVAAVVEYAAQSPAIVGWGAENEPYLASHRTQTWNLSREFVAEEVRVIREHDPLRRPVSINHGQHFVFDRRWQDAIEDSDALGQSLYPFRNVNLLRWRLVVPILEMGPLTPNYAWQGSRARAEGKEYWITEMQAEPWTDEDLRLFSPGHPSPNLTPGRFRKNIDYARRTGASRVYLWGAEWWLYERERFGDTTWWDLAREAIQGKPGSNAGEESRTAGR